MLDRLAAGPPVGVLRPRPSGEPSPATALLMRGLLVPVDALTVELPREVGIALRPSPLGVLEPEPPTDRGRRARAGRARPARHDGRARTPCGWSTSLADTWTAHPPAQLRSGGVGVRELRRTARDLGVDETTVALIAEVAAAAGLLNATHGLEPVYLPTAEFDTWRTARHRGPLVPTSRSPGSR